MHNDDFTKMGAIISFLIFFIIGASGNSQAQWTLVGEKYFSQANMRNPTIAVHDGVPYVAYIGRGKELDPQKTMQNALQNAFSEVDDERVQADESGKTQPSPQGAIMYKFENERWQPVGKTPFSSGGARQVSIEISSAGTPYAAYVDKNHRNQATVKKYNGSKWVPVGQPGFSVAEAKNIELRLDQNDVPYVIYSDGNRREQATIQKFKNSQWKYIGGKGVTQGPVEHPHLGFDDNNLYFTAGTIYKKYDGKRWNMVFDSLMLFDDDLYISSRLYDDKTLYALYHTPSKNLVVRKIKNNSWKYLGGSLSDGSVAIASIAFDADRTPYVSYINLHKTGRAFTKKFSKGQWILLQDKTLIDRIVDPLEMVIENNVAYVVMREDVEEAPIVMKYTLK